MTTIKVLTENRAYRVVRNDYKHKRWWRPAENRANILLLVLLRGK